ncbi:MAG: phosphotransferase [Ktedonobacteraceae bacterium]
MNLEEILQCINTINKTTFALVEKYPDGEQGAFLVADRLGKQWVLKWAPGARNLQWMQGAKTVTDLLRGIGYPAPDYLLIGQLSAGIYSVQNVLPGSPLRKLTPALLSRLLELNEMQLGRAIPGRKDWHQEAISVVLSGGDGYCLHASLKLHSQDTAELLHALQALVTAHQDEPHRATDIVHGDFNPANILVQDGQVSGIVDWDGSYAGDCTFDLATLLFYAYDEVEARICLWEYALERASLKLLSIYLAHLILRQVDWSLRYHDQSTSGRYILRGQALLQEIARRARSAC